MLEIIELPISEWEAYRELRVEALQLEPQAFGASYESTLKKTDAYWQDRLRSAADEPGQWLLFAKEQEQLVGMVAAFVRGESTVVDVISLYVNPASRGKGVGKLLMAALLEKLRSSSSFEIAALTVNQGQASARQMYESFGFNVVGEEDSVMGDGHTYRGLLMELRLRH